MSPKSAAECGVDRTEAFYEGKTVLVTGGGGSIGGELCRKLAAVHAKKIVILDICENGAYDVMCYITAAQRKSAESAGASEHTETVVEIASVASRTSLERVFEKHRPQIVFHAAAHKHVPLMESCPLEAIENNVVGTFNCMELAMLYGTERFLLISTDKAVRPSSIMGATKRAGEIMLSSFAKSSPKTLFFCVRFGNVAESAGSVIPLFNKQIAAGGPVTVTDRRAERYLMTVSEAVELVTTVCASEKAGGLFILDMGKPVKIIELAEELIRKAGVTPYRNIEIIETGLRPGEKLTEELILPNGRLLPTENKRVFAVDEETPSLTPERLSETISLLRLAAEFGKEDVSLEVLRRLAPDYTPASRAT